MNRTLLLVILLLCFGTSPFLLSIEITPSKNITLSEEQGIIERGFSFVVTENEQVFVVDMKAGDIKIFDMTGKRLKVFGSKGIGPNEFVRPVYSAYRKPYLALMDIRRSMMFIYKRLDKNKFEYCSKFIRHSLAIDFKFMNDEALLIAGDRYDKNKRRYSLIEYNFKTHEFELLIPSEIAFGFSSLKEFERENKKSLRYIGHLLFFDYAGDNIYIVWQGSNIITWFNRETKKIVRFGESSKNYVKAFYTSEIEKAFKEMNHRLLYKLYRPMSFVRKLFVTPGNNIGVVYAGPFKENGDLPVFVQLYTKEGKYLKEVKLLDAKASHTYESYFYFSKTANRLYIMDTVTSEEFDQSYEVYEFQVQE